MIRISAPHFVAGAVLYPWGECYRAAPIIKYMIGWSRDQIISYCCAKRWTFEVM